jgi:hypothetical protein
MPTKTTNTKRGSFIYQRHDTAETFTCGRCNREKKAKIRVTWNTPEGEKLTICNGCYGLLLSKK